MDEMYEVSGWDIPEWNEAMLREVAAASGATTEEEFYV